MTQKVRANKIPSRQYTGREIVLTDEELQSLLYTGDKKKPSYLLPGRDFEVLEYTDNINAGKARVTLHGMGAYGSTKTLTFRIKGRNEGFIGALIEGLWR